MVSRTLSTVMAITVGLLVLADFFTNDHSINALGLYLVRSASVVAAFALVLGMVNVLTVHLNKITHRDKGWIYSVVLLVALLGTLGAGFLSGGPASPLVQDGIFETLLFPLEATLFSLLAFFVVTAIYRAFRVKSFESFWFVLFGIIVLLGQVPVGSVISGGWLPIIKDWILDVPALAGARGVLLGVALGTVATGLRVLLGIDRPYVD